jgi:DEAD/DEAH box helicase domain-containing protein
MKAIAELTVIEWFSDRGFLPRYGFPIHLQRLSVRVPRTDKPDKSTTAEGYRLERQSLLALAEYVPGAQVLVGGKIAESRGILKHWTEENRDEALGLNYWALRCVNEHDYLAASADEPCKECGHPPQGLGQALMFPRFGYTTAAWDPPKPPGRNLDRVGEVVLSTASGFNLTDVTSDKHDCAGMRGLTARYYEAGQGELLIRNAGGDAWNPSGFGFAVCTRCGFAVSEEKPFNPNGPAPALPKQFKEHASVFSANPNSRCWPKNLAYDPVLRHKVLAARETTDVLILDWPIDAEQRALYSLGRALILAGARLLELDSREIGLELKPRGNGESSLLFYDTVPGGAGHCFELLNLGRLWLDQAAMILRGSPEHDAICRRACLECLLDFSGQFRANLLDRRAALELIDAMILGGTSAEAAQVK